MTVNLTEINIDVGATQQITTTITHNGNIVSNPTLIYSSDNENIATVDSTGIVNAVSQGTCNITVLFIDGDSITYTKTIPTTINAVVAKTIKFSTTYQNIGEIKIQLSLLKGRTANISVYACNSSQQSDTFTFSFSGVDISYYIRTIIDGNNFSVTNINGDGSEYLTITATSDVDSSVVGSITIRLAGVW
ncbi:Ig-like domain-containing protein [Clostridium sp. BJN0013]|uniref:Ig-like domain-containing protein n=1 Tax=Clostridium sp. BJN0013 TaxID=3236840 RepID=UPI0034C5E842